MSSCDHSLLPSRETSPHRMSFQSADLDTETLLEKPTLSTPYKSSYTKLVHLSHRYLRLSREEFTKPSAITSEFLRCLVLLLPSPIQPSLARSVPLGALPVSSNITVLDSLRGLACLIVVNQHYTYNFTTAIFRGYGSPVAGPNTYITQLPFVSVLWSGHAMVSVFFILSGLVLSHKPLRLSRDPSVSYDKLFINIASSIFRRGFRLYIPVMTSTLLVSLLSYMGVYDIARHNRATYPNLITSNEPAPDRFPSISQHVNQWWDFLIRQFRDGNTPNLLDLHTWTIPVEFDSSMTLFLVLAGLCRLRYRWRTLFLLGLIVWAVHFDIEGLFLFLSGMFLADVSLATSMSGGANRAAPEPGLRPETEGTQADEVAHCSARVRRTEILRKVFYGGLVIAGLYLCSQPAENPHVTPGFIWLQSLRPSTWGVDRPFWRSIGAILLVWSAFRSEEIQYWLDSRPIRYLGKISFALYLMHGPVIRSLGYTIIPSIYTFTGGRDTQTGFVGAWAITAIIVAPVIWWAADLFWRLVDAPSVTFGKWLEGKLVINPL